MISKNTRQQSEIKTELHPDQSLATLSRVARDIFLYILYS